MKNKLRAAAWLLAVTLAGSGLAMAQDGYGYHDHDDGYSHDGYGYDRYGHGRYGYNDAGLGIAHNTGYDDGSRVAYHDLTHRNPFNPFPRGKFAHEDHGYHHEYGDKFAYRVEYERGYRAGYGATFRRY